MSQKFFRTIGATSAPVIPVPQRTRAASNYRSLTGLNVVGMPGGPHLVGHPGQEDSVSSQVTSYAELVERGSFVDVLDNARVVAAPGGEVSCFAGCEDHPAESALSLGAGGGGLRTG